MNAPNFITGQFNRDVTIATGIVTLKKDGAPYESFTQDEIIVTGNSFSIDVTNLLLEVGVYTVTIPKGLFISIFNEVFDIFTLDFTIQGAEFEPSEFSNEFFI